MLNEARRNPELNKRNNPIREISKYAGQKDVFVSFTTGFDKNMRSKAGQNKIGINPSSQYDTPFGIYAYPVDYLIQYNTNNNELSAPFTGSTPWKYAYILRRITPNFIDSASNPHDLINRLDDFGLKYFSKEDMASIRGFAFSTARDPTEASKAWNYSRLLATNLRDKLNKKNSSATWNMIMRNIGVDAYIDDLGEGLIHPSEPTQAVFFSVQAFNVIDVITRTKSGVNAERVRQMIKDRATNLYTISPSIIASTVMSSIVSKSLTADDFHWVNNNVEELTKRLIIDRLNYVNDHPFEDDVLTNLSIFGKISPSALIDYFISYSKRFDWQLLAKYLGRNPTPAEHTHIIKNISLYSLHTFINSINDCGFTAINFNQLLTRIGVASRAFSHEVEFDVKALLDCLARNHIDADDKILGTLFGMYPLDMFKQYPDHDWSFLDWMRAVRSKGIELISPIIPISMVPTVVSKLDADNEVSMSEKLMERLIKENPEFLVEWLPRHGQYFWHNDVEGMDDFVVEYFDRMVEINHRFISMLATHDYHPSKRLMKKIMVEIRTGKNTANMLSTVCKLGWISQHQFRSVMNRDNAYAILGWHDYGWGEVDPKLFVDALILCDDIDKIPATKPMLEILFRDYASLSRYWHGNVSEELADYLVETYPKVINSSVWSAMSIDKMFSILRDGNDSSFLNMIPKKQAAEVLDKLVNENPEKAVELLVLQDNSVFSQLRDPWLIERMTTLPLIEKILHGRKVSDEAATIISNMFTGNITRLQLIVSYKFMEWFLDTSNIHKSLFVKPFGNEIPDELLAKVQIANLSAVAFGSTTGIYVERAEEMVELFYRVPPQTIAWMQKLRETKNKRSGVQ